MNKTPPVHSIDKWLSKFPGSMNVKVGVASVAIIGITGYFYFKSDVKSGHGMLDSERPEAVFEAMDQEKQKSVNMQIPKPK